MAQQPNTLDGITAKQITTSRLTTRVLFSGDEGATPVIFVHGNVSSATFWEQTMLNLPAEFRGIAPDNRGYGGADRDVKIDSTRGCGDLSDDLASLMDTLGIEKAHVVGHSLGGSVLWRFMTDYSDRILSVTQVAPGSPYGFGGCKGLDGELNYPDNAGSGAGIVSGDFVNAIKAGDTSADSPSSPRNIMNNYYWKAPFTSPRADDLVLSMLSIHTGDDAYAGDGVPSTNWPMSAPGKFGPNNMLAPIYRGDVDALYSLENKPPVLWIRGADDQIVSDTSLFDAGFLGQLGAIPGWPGADVFPPQLMVSQTRAVLEKYHEAGGQFEEVAIPECGHTPYIEKEAEFDQAFHAFLKSV
jgi:pimeloyl-ACP methyl ester carboxylesterase